MAERITAPGAIRSRLTGRWPGGLPAVPAHPVRWTAADAVLVLLGTQLLSLLWAGGGVALAYGSEGAPSPMPVAALFLLNIGLWAGYGLGPVVVVRRKGVSLASDLGARLARFDAPAGLAAGIVAQAVLMPALYWPIGRLIEGDPGASARELVGSTRGPFQVLVLVAATAVLAPLTEELFYRGLFLRGLVRRFGPVVGAVVSSAVFAAVHLDALAAPGLFVFGLLSAALALATGRLGPSVAFHVGFNLTTLVMLGLF